MLLLTGTWLTLKFCPEKNGFERNAKNLPTNGSYVARALRYVRGQTVLRNVSHQDGRVDMTIPFLIDFSQ